MTWDDARNEVIAAMREREWTGVDLAVAAKVNRDTVNDFVRGDRNLGGRSQARIERALGMPYGRLAKLATLPEAAEVAEAYVSHRADRVDDMVTNLNVDELARLPERAIAELARRAARDNPDATR